MRRFQPAPDSTIDQGDRQAVAFMYSGIEAGELVIIPPPSIGVIVRIDRSVAPTVRIDRSITSTVRR